MKTQPKKKKKNGNKTKFTTVYPRDMHEVSKSEAQGLLKWKHEEQKREEEDCGKNFLNFH